MAFSILWIPSVSDFAGSEWLSIYLSLYFGTHLEQIINKFLEPLHERGEFCFSSQLKMTSHHYVHVITDYLYILPSNSFVDSSTKHVFDFELA